MPTLLNLIYIHVESVREKYRGRGISLIKTFGSLIFLSGTTQMTSAKVSRRVSRVFQLLTSISLYGLSIVKGSS